MFTKKLTYIVVTMVATNFVFFAHPVFADSAPAQYYGTNIVSSSSNSISLKKEQLNMNIQTKTCKNGENYKYDCSSFDVVADFIFDSPQDEKLTVFFPVPDLEMQIEASDENIEIYKKSLDFDNWEFNNKEIVPTIKSVEFPFILKSPSGIIVSGFEEDNNTLITSMVTELSFKKGENHLIVKYTVPVTNNRGISNIDYILSSGSLWKGTIEDLEVRINFDKAIEPLQLVDSNYRYTNINNKTFMFRAYDIEPTKEIHFQFIPTFIFSEIKPLIEGKNISINNRKEINNFLVRYLSHHGAVEEVSCIDDNSLLCDTFFTNLEYIATHDTQDTQYQALYLLYRIADLENQYRNLRTEYSKTEDEKQKKLLLQSKDTLDREFENLKSQYENLAQQDLNEDDLQYIHDLLDLHIESIEPESEDIVPTNCAHQPECEFCEYSDFPWLVVYALTAVIVVVTGALILVLLRRKK